MRWLIAPCASSRHIRPSADGAVLLRSDAVLQRRRPFRLLSELQRCLPRRAVFPRHAAAYIEASPGTCRRSAETSMIQIPPRPPRILVMHPDPLLSAGLVAALREHGDFEVCLDGAGAMAEDAPPVDVVIADYANAMRLADEAVRSGYRSLATARVLALTSNDREADIRRAIEAGVRGYLLVGGPIGDLIEGVTL